MKLVFEKMQGLGNDFVILDATQSPVNLSVQIIRKMSHRQLGIGFDQLLVIEASHDKTSDFNYRIFNADGNEVEQCGNGARCVTRYIHERKLSNKNPLILKTKKGQLKTFLQENKFIQVEMGNPLFKPAEIPFLTKQTGPLYQIEIDHQLVEFAVVNIGNPHAVIRVEKISPKEVQSLGSILEKHPSFPEKANVGFMQILNPHSIQLQVFERGTGPTLACGSGACAAMAIGKKLGWLSSAVKVLQPGGELEILWDGVESSPLKMIGPAEFVFAGEYIY